MTRVCVIPARAGSKRLPGKNMLSYRGEPAVTWPIRAAVHSGMFEHVIVSTDDIKIADEAARYNAAIMMRPAHLARDAATVIDVLKHALWGTHYDYVCVVYATAVRVTPDDFLGSWHLLAQPETTMVVSVVPYMNTHGWHYKSNGFPCWVRGSDVSDLREFHDQRAALYVIDPIRGRDVDTAEDWRALTEAA